MKHKSGLHKRVSSIFGDVPLPDNPSPKPSAGDNEVLADKTEVSPFDFGNPGFGSPEQPSSTLLEPKVVSKTQPLSEDEEYEASQRKKLYMSFCLAGFLGLVLFFNFYKPGKKAVVKAKETSVISAAVKASELVWPEPAVWPVDVRDPMVFREDAANLYVLESKNKSPLVLRGIIHNPGGKSMALIGTDIFYEGDEVEGWTVKEILLDAARL